jgi:hypothetical protein
MATAKLLGRSTAATGAAEEITVGSGLSLSAGTLSASGGGVTTIGFGTTGLTPSGATSGVVTVAGTLAVANGGTGVTTSTGTTNNVLSASPTFTGVPAAPTAASATNTTQLATTAFAYGTLSASSNGYTKLANGLIIQWGTISGSGSHGTSYSGTFPLTFPNNAYTLAATNQQGVGTTTTQVIMARTALSTTGFTVQYGAQNGGAYTYNYKYIAIGN